MNKGVEGKEEKRREETKKREETQGRKEWKEKEGKERMETEEKKGREAAGGKEVFELRYTRAVGAGYDTRELLCAQRCAKGIHASCVRAGIIAPRRLFPIVGRGPRNLPDPPHALRDSDVLRRVCTCMSGPFFYPEHVCTTPLDRCTQGYHKSRKQWWVFWLCKKTSTLLRGH